MSYEGMKNKNQKLKEEIGELQLKLGECPAGNLNCVNNKGYYKWYYHKDSMQLHIAKLNGRICGAKRSHSISAVGLQVLCKR